MPEGLFLRTVLRVWLEALLLVPRNHAAQPRTRPRAPGGTPADPRQATVTVRVRPAAFYPALALLILPPVLIGAVVLSAVVHPWAGVGLLVVIAVAAAFLLPYLHPRGLVYLAANAAGVRYQPLTRAR